MAYTAYNYKSKADVKRALAAGKPVRVFQPGPFGPGVSDGDCSLEGPHFPEPHRWYGSGEVKDGMLLSIK